MTGRRRRLRRRGYWAPESLRPLRTGPELTAVALALAAALGALIGSL